MKKFKSLALIFSILFFQLSCEKIGTDNSSNTSSVNKQKLLDLVNSARKKGCNCGSTYYQATEPIIWNDLLEKAAVNHSKDMDKNNYFSHTSQDGTSFSERITAAGYNWTTCAENIAQGYTTEEAVIKGWLESVGHCKNIMNPDYKEMGVGKSGDYWTQTFGSQE